MPMSVIREESLHRYTAGVVTSVSVALNKNFFNQITYTGFLKAFYLEFKTIPVTLEGIGGGPHIGLGLH